MLIIVFILLQPVGIYRGKYEWANENSPVGGDCSLWVRAATLQLDDGQWQCQVTASNYDVQVYEEWLLVYNINIKNPDIVYSSHMKIIVRQSNHYIALIL